MGPHSHTIRVHAHAHYSEYQLPYFVTLTNKFQGNPITYDSGVGGTDAGGRVEVRKGLVFLIPGTRSDEF